MYLREWPDDRNVLLKLLSDEEKTKNGVRLAASPPGTLIGLDKESFTPSVLTHSDFISTFFFWFPSSDFTFPNRRDAHLVDTKKNPPYSREPVSGWKPFKIVSTKIVSFSCTIRLKFSAHTTPDCWHQSVVSQFRELSSFLYSNCV